MMAACGIEIIRPEMEEILRDDSRMERVAGGFRFVEGPVWWHEKGGLIFSDIPADRIYFLTADGVCRVFRSPSHHANGNTVDRQGRLLTCEHGTRRVTRTTPDGTVEVIASTYRGKRLNSPNDIAVKSDGTVWFTDPTYGIRPEMKEQPANNLFRLDPSAEEPVPVVSDCSMPNGLCFSPDERILYLADSDRSIHHVLRFSVSGDNTLSDRKVFAVIEAGVPDGMRCDRDGRLYVATADGVAVYTPQGEMVGILRTPEVAANCAFGGADMATLYITATGSVWAVRLAVSGLRRSSPA